MEHSWVYFMTNRPNGTLYVGVTTDLVRRVWQHRTGEISGFTATHGLKRLVYFEQHESITSAIQREKNIKHWSRAWKVGLILQANREWADLYDGLLYQPFWRASRPPCVHVARRGWPGRARP